MEVVGSCLGGLLKDCAVNSGHRAGVIELSFTLTSDSTVSLEGVPSGTTLSLLARGTDPKYGPRTASEEDEGVLKWYFSEEEVQEFYDEGVLFVDIRSGDSLLLTGDVRFYRWGQSPEFMGTVTYVSGPAGVGVPDGGLEGQILAKASDDDFDTEWVSGSGGGGPVYWGDVRDKPDEFPPEPHSHSISDVVGLQEDLDGKADTEEVFSGDYEDLINIPEEFPPSSHTHSVSDVVGLQGILDDKLEEGDIPPIPTEPSDIGAQPEGDYVEDSDPRLSDARDPKPHNHTIGDVTGLEDTLDDKLESSDLQGYVEESDLADVATSGDYEDLDNTPPIPSTAQDVGALPDDAELGDLDDVSDSGGSTGDVLTKQGDGSWAPSPPGSASEPYTSNPEGLGTASPGSSSEWSRGDHVHPMPSATDVGARPVGVDIPWGDVDGKPSTYPPSSHTHPISDVTGLQGELDDKLESDDLQDYVKSSDLADVATSGEYDDLEGTPDWIDHQGDPDPASATGQNSLAIGGGATSTGNKGVAIGFDSKSSSGVAVGRGSEVVGGGVSVGTNVKTVGTNNISIGSDSSSTGMSSITLGRLLETDADQAILVGGGSVVSGRFGITVGFLSEVSGRHGISFGYESKVEGEHSLALGSYSLAEDDYEVSVGTPGDPYLDEPIPEIHRKITYVEDGTEDHHAATVGQVPSEPSDIGAVAYEGSTPLKLWTGTQAQYDAISNPDPNTIYVVEG